MTSKITPSLPTGLIRTDAKDVIYLINCYCIPVWRNDIIAWFDIYSSDGYKYLGKRKDLKECEELDARIRR